MARHLAVGESLGPLPVDSRSYFNPTGVLLDRGATYEIVADDSTWVDWAPPVWRRRPRPPEHGQSMAQWALRCKAGKWFQLIGAVGPSDDYVFPRGSLLDAVLDAREGVRLLAERMQHLEATSAKKQGFFG